MGALRATRRRSTVEASNYPLLIAAATFWHWWRGHPEENFALELKPCLWQASHVFSKKNLLARMLVLIARGDTAGMVREILGHQTCCLHLFP